MHRKLVLTFVLIIIAAAVLPAAAQRPFGVPEICEAEASRYLGTWSLDTFCENSNCLDAKEHNVIYILELNSDNTMTVFRGEDDYADKTYWYTQNGKAYFINYSESHENDEIRELEIDDYGRVVLEGDGFTMIFSRSRDAKLVNGGIRHDAVSADFEGEWHLYQLLTEKDAIPLVIFQVEGTVTVKDDGLLDVEINNEAQNDISYLSENGVISAAVKDAETKEEVPCELLGV